MNCPACSAPITEQPHRGRSRIYCSPACRIATKRAAEKRRRAIPAAERDLEDALAAHAKHGLPVTAERVERARVDLNALTTPSKEIPMTTQPTLKTIPEGHRLIIVFQPNEKDRFSNGGYEVEHATSYTFENHEALVYRRDAQPCSFADVLFVALVADPGPAFPKVPDWRSNA